jgi:hypothetical protein
VKFGDSFLEKTGTFRQKFGSESPLGRDFSPQKRKEKIDEQIDVTFYFQIQILLEEYLSYR